LGKGGQNSIDDLSEGAQTPGLRVAPINRSIGTLALAPLLMLIPLVLMQSRSLSQSRHGPTKPAVKTDVAARGTAKLTLCPPAGSPTTPSSQARIGRHEVFLSWNAAVSSTGRSGTVDGYCVYRSKKPAAAKQKPTCRDCERLSAIPVTGTACFDDLVTDGTTYYYVVTAVKDDQMSSSSNEIAAHIPAGPHRSSISAQLHRAPSCRNSAADKHPQP
jgi:hypothetical protein